jgi:hypothetical protein
MRDVAYGFFIANAFKLTTATYKDGHSGHSDDAK